MHQFQMKVENHHQMSQNLERAGMKKTNVNVGDINYK